MAASADRSKPYIPNNNGTNDGWSTEHEATATCFCGAVQLAFPTEAPGLVDNGQHICNCSDCRKITASMFASNFNVLTVHVKHLRGQNLLTRFAQSKTIKTGNTMTDHFCSKCGTLMYRVSSGWPDLMILRIGTVDDLNLHGTKLKPKVEQFVEDRVGWCSGGEKGGVDQFEGFYYAKQL